MVLSEGLLRALTGPELVNYVEQNCHGSPVIDELLEYIHAIHSKVEDAERMSSDAKETLKEAESKEKDYEKELEEKLAEQRTIADAALEQLRKSYEERLLQQHDVTNEKLFAQARMHTLEMERLLAQPRLSNISCPVCMASIKVENKCP